MAEWIGAAEAARRLGIKEASLYSYVSRGLLARRTADGSRTSLFAADEVERLAIRGRPRGSQTDRPPRASRAVPQGAELVIETAITELTEDQLRFRGLDAIILAESWSFERVAELLWTGEAGPATMTAAGSAGSAGSAGFAGFAGSAGSAGAAEAGGWRATAEDWAAAAGSAEAGGWRATAEDWAAAAGSAEAGGWRATAAAVAAGSAAQAALPAATLPLERLQVIVPALAAADPFRLHLDPPAVAAAGRCLISGMVDCLPLAGADRSIGRLAVGETGAADSIAGRLITKLCPVEPVPGLVDVLQAALVLLADHELAASTLAARVAASMRADPYAVVATGLGAVGGALHGGASFGAEVMLRSASEPADAARVVGELLRRGERIPGFGHFVYRGSDPRAVCLLDRLRRVAPDAPALAVAAAVIDEAQRRALPAPNIDFALAVLGTVGQLVPGAGEAIFAVARAAGWIAHALEEYDRRTPIRPRGIYTGPVHVY